MRTIGKLITADMPLGSLWRLNPEQEATLEKLHIATVHDLLRHYPSRYEEPGQAKHIADCAALETVTLTGTITKSEARRAFKKKTPLGEATLDDGTGTLTLIWFHQPYMAKKFGVGAQVQVRGQVRERNKKISIINPDIEFSTGETTPLLGSPKSLAPVYPASAGISSQWFAYHIGELLGRRAHERLSDPLPDDLRARYKLPSLSASLFYVHAPQRLSDARAAQKRFAFEEVFFLNLVRLRDRESYQELGSPRLAAPESAPKLFSHNADVDRVNEEILAKLPGKPQAFPMSSRGSDSLVAALKKGCLSPETLYLKVGAAVMFTKNNPKEGFVNGTLGEVKEFNKYRGNPV
ncbi:MAG: ATP-dependent DNA helicase RecG, partial [Parcubacteria group bacterium GW2011_GWF1_52_5]